MRIFLLLLSTAVFSFSTVNSLAQNKITINSSKLVSVDEVFKIIMDQTDYHFMYPVGIFKDTPKVQLKKGTIKIKDLLKQSIAAAQFGVVLSANNTIVIKKRSEQQQRQVFGIVKDKEGVPLPGVVVLIKGTNNGVSSNFEGKYKITVPDITSVLVFSCMGYETKEVIVDEQKVINIILNEDISDLDEVLITGYQKISVNRSTGATSNVQAETIERKGNSNLLESLEGQVAGLGFFSDPTQEGVTKFDIRGVTSLVGDSRPLIIVDGFPLEANISTINPYEVESVTFLKDAASTSIYGARAANGVVVILTKRGKSGKLDINYRSFLTTSSSPDLSYRLNRVSSADLVEIQKLAAGSNPHTYEWRYNNAPSSASSFAEAASLVYNTMGLLNEGTITQGEADATLENLKNIDNLNQLQDHFFQSSFEQQHNISISGGGERNTFRTSLNYTTAETDRVGSNSDRIILDVLNNFKINDKLDFDLIGNVVLNNSKSTPVPDNLIFGGINSYEEIIDENGNFLPVRIRGINTGLTTRGWSAGSKEPFEVERLIGAGLLDETYYPLKELGAYTTDVNELSVRLQSMLNIKFTDALSGHVAFQYEAGNVKSKKISSSESFEVVNLINNTTPLTYSGSPDELNVPLGARLTETRSNRNSYTLRGQLDFNKTLSKHEISAIAGSEVRNVFDTQTVVDKFGYDDATLLFASLNTRDLEERMTNVYIPGGRVNSGIRFADDFSESTNRYFSLYGNLTYAFDDKYIISGSARVDQSNLFGTDPEYRYKPFWSVGGKWRVKEESFFDMPMINKLDFRMSYGINGNVSNNSGPFNIARYITASRAGGVQSLYISSPAISDLRWERTGTTNFGMDVSFLNDKINLGLDYYIKKTTDLLANGKTNPTQGFSTLVRNDADIINKGIEVVLSTKNITTDNFSWSSFLTFRYNKNRVSKSYSDEEHAGNASGLRNYEGAPANTLWYFDWNGLNEDGNGTIKAANGEIIPLNSAFRTASSVVVDDLVNAGTVEPIYTGAITNTFAYKNLKLSFMFIGNGGHVLVKDSYNGLTVGRYPTNLTLDAANAWKEPGDENITDVPAVNQQSTYARIAMTNSTKNVVDADYLKLREIILTYEVPKEILNFGVQFNLKANDLFYVAKNKEGIDPENHGIGRRYFPNNPTYSLGVLLNF
ncbi:SusC/RagA family TonB-linked outer membrane protein [Algibacter miyuki]|uniref:SusC/RagA family TonB-linked outer membrane protein n=1 Tax=Algibacter miyuki TaxID=1306933 RepID=A0ABV5H2N6_9FLAO|nr:SusC/RagA family TonB-linked outer membrane protein [Algibacter miyuki]MDN3663847.1 SusC/RagA family TonB-linked outer membrane protein [Algibacter miyuki]